MPGTHGAPARAVSGPGATTGTGALDSTTPTTGNGPARYQFPYRATRMLCRVRTWTVPCDASAVSCPTIATP
eukprot:1009188-Rhodomonas_salina.3